MGSWGILAVSHNVRLGFNNLSSIIANEINSSNCDLQNIVHFWPVKRKKNYFHKFRIGKQGEKVKLEFTINFPLIIIDWLHLAPILLYRRGLADIKFKAWADFLSKQTARVDMGWHPDRGINLLVQKKYGQVPALNVHVRMQRGG